MRVFLYEHLTGGGAFWDGDLPPTGSMLREGTAMLSGVLADFHAIADTDVALMWDSRLADASMAAHCVPIVDSESHASAFERLVRETDFALLIAPEINGALLQLTRRAEQLGAQLLCPDSDFVALASDKLVTDSQLRRAGVPVPATVLCQTRHDLAQLPAGPLVRKPIDGAGSWQVRLTDQETLASSWNGEQVLVQEFCAGRPASIGTLCGGLTPCLLPPCWQHVEPPLFVYQGGQTIFEPDLIARAHDLAWQTLEALPPTRGYVGIDVVLGASSDGRQDVVIEVNPRLTTSYVGLRQIALSNLGQALWRSALGHSTDLSFSPRRLQFDLAGTALADFPTAADNR